MRIAIIGVFAFVVGLAGTTGFLVLRAPVPPAQPEVAPPPAAPAQAAARPVATVATNPAQDSVARTAPVSATPDSARPTPPAAAPAVPEAAAAPAADQAAAGPAQRPVEVTLSSPRSFAGVSKILVSMKPKEAAKIFEHLNDDEVEGILSRLTPRLAAGLLGQLPAERAALMSRRLIEHGQEAKK